LVDALVSNTCGKPCRFDSGSGYKNLFLTEEVFSILYHSNYSSEKKQQLLITTIIICFAAF
jgi:hypothetical protein